MAREAHAEGARRNKEVWGEKQPSSFPSLHGPKVVLCFLATMKIDGKCLIATAPVGCVPLTKPLPMSRQKLMNIFKNQ